MGPQALEVDGVRQDQIRVLGDALRRQEVADVTLGHVANPLVDLIPHFNRIRLEIGLDQLIAEEVQHAFAQLLLVRHPESVR